MCELFGVSAKYATDVQHTLTTFAEHGGLTGPHKDGWGIAYFQGNEAWLVKAPEQAAQSATLKRIQALAPKSSLIISHIRLATQGEISLHNTQPFSHPLDGQTLVFAHNGHVTSVVNAKLEQYFKPNGSTDSEVVFSAILALMEKSANEDISKKAAELEAFLTELSPLGPLNVLFSEGEYLFAFSNKRTQPDGEIKSPGMHFICRKCSESKIGNLDTSDNTSDQQQLVLFASVPLSTEHWQPMTPNKLYVATKGELIQDHIFQPYSAVTL
jgi:glutamine amidotransferase